MIQNSMNQLLGIAGVVGGYLSKARADQLRPQMQAAADRKSADIDAAKDKVELQKVGEPKSSIRGKLTTPIQILGEAKVQESKLKEQYFKKMDSLPDMQMHSEEEGQEKMLHPGDDPSEATQKSAVNEPVYIGGQKVNFEQLSPRMQQFLAGQASPQEQARAVAMQSFAGNGNAKVQQAQDLANLKDILKSRHSKGANRKEALDYIQKREKENK